MKYKIVADSSANMTALGGVDFAVASLSVIAGDMEYSDDRDAEAMVAALAAYNGRSSTSCPSIGEWLSAFGDADRIFAVTITSGLSGSYSSALQARDEYLRQRPDAQVCVIDSLSAGPEMMLIVEQLRDYIREGHSFEWISAAIGRYADSSRLLFALRSYRNLANNGRVNGVVAKLAGALGIVITGAASDEGTLDIRHKCRGQKSAVKTLFEDMISFGYSGGKVRIAHCQNPDIARSLADLIRSRYPDADVFAGPTGVLCSYYAELGGIMLGFEAPPV